MKPKTKIEKGIPMPYTSRKYKYPLDRLEIGDSFIFAGTTDAKTLIKARTLCFNYSKRWSKLFKAYTFENTIRIWRTE